MDQRYKHGQWAQDTVLEQLCYPAGNETHQGIFVEIGAWDGVEISNTYWLEKCKDWTGLLVEPIATRAESAKHNRWVDVWQGCVFDRDGEVDFLHIAGYSEMLSGIEEAYHPSHKQRVAHEITQHDQKTETIKVPCKTINSLLDSFKLVKADVLSLDVQTVELRVLKAYDPKKNPIKAIVLDFNGINEGELKQWFEENGYKLHWKHERSDEHIYVHPDIKWSWE